VDHQAEKEGDNCDQVMLSGKRFHGSAKLSKLAEQSESLAANRDGPLGITMEGEELDFLDRVCNCTEMTQSSGH